MGGKHAGPAYREYHEALIHKAIAQGTLSVACDPTLEGAILGFAVYDVPKRLVHYVYTRDGIRNMGIAKALLAPLLDGKPVTMTHRLNDNAFYLPLPGHEKPVRQRDGTTKVISVFPIPEGWDFNPYLFFSL